MPEPSAAIGLELMSLERELEQEVHAAFERVRAEHGKAGSPWARRSNREAFLVIEHQRRALEVRVHGADRRSGDRYRELLLITKLIALEYELLAGRAGRRTAQSSLPEGPPAPGKDPPADWAQPWGVGAMYELRAALRHFSQRRDRLARRLSAATLASATADAEREIDGIRISSGLERGTGERRREAKPEPVTAARPEKPQRRPSKAHAAKARAVAAARKPTRARPGRNAVVVGAGAIAAALLLAGVNSKLGSDWPSISGSDLNRSSAGGPARPPPSAANFPREPKPAPQRPRKRPLQPKPAPKPEKAVADQPATPEPDESALAMSEVPITPALVPEAAPAKSTPPPKPSPPKSKPPKPSPPPKFTPAQAPAPAPAPALAPAPAPH